MYELKIKIESVELGTVIMQVLTELNRAKSKHPEWPKCNIKRMSFVNEEAGEATKEVNQIEEGISTLSDFKIELIQTASTAIRLLETLAIEANGK